MEEEVRLTIKVLHLAYLVHEKTDYCVFIRFSGHVDRLEIDIRESQVNWETQVLRSEFSTKYMALRDARVGEKRAELQARIEVLEQILADNEISYDDLDYEEEYIRHYTF